jgi:hypothetical protein
MGDLEYQRLAHRAWQFALATAGSPAIRERTAELFHHALARGRSA